MQAEKLKELVKRAILVAYWRNGDVDTEDGTFATTNTDDMIHLESAIQDMFGLEVHELYSLLRSGVLLDKKLEPLHMQNGMSELENNVRASAVMNFVEAIRGAYGSGFIDNNPTVYDIYRSAQHHVKDNYGIDTENWEDDLAKESRSEWRNGDKAMLGDTEVLVIGYHPEHPAIVVEGGDGLDIVGICNLKKLKSEV